MGLTDEERRRLDELANELSREDPYLGRALTGGSSRRRYHSAAVAVLLAILSLALSVLGVTVQQPVLFAVGWLLLIAAVWIAAVMGYRRYGRRRRDRRA
jgi:hypothetical protein